MMDHLLVWMAAFLQNLSLIEMVFAFFSLTGFYTFGAWIFSVFLYPFYFSPLRHLPGPKDDVFFIGQTPKFLQVSWLPELFCNWSRQWPTAPFIRYLNFANSETLVVNSITAYKEVLTKKSSCFVKPSFASRFAWEFIGNGLPFVEGHLHKVRRAVLMKPFSTPRLKAFVPVIQNKARQLVDVLQMERTSLGNVEVETHIWKAVLDIIGVETFSIDLNHLQSNKSVLFDCFISTMNQSTLSHIINYFNSIFPIRRLLPIAECREFARNTATVREFIRGHIDARRESMSCGTGNASDSPDALQCMLEHWDSCWNYDEIVEYVYNILVLGHDTTACSIIWAVHELSCRPADQQRLRDEVNNLYQKTTEPTYNDIEKLPFMNNFVCEVLRMYCAVALAPREATRDVDIAGILIPKGTVLQLSPAVINLHPLIWGDDAATFNADRWDNLTGDASTAYAFETFHNGPRMCIGKQLSIIEMKAFIMELITRFSVEPVHSGANAKIASPTFTLKMKEKLVVRLVEL
ncbi:Fc.00g092580.m01.CDS01 [Cosmosporella sp. VM-42]